MPNPPADADVKKKLAEMRTRLLADPSKEELDQMHLHIDALSKWANLNTMRQKSHDHDMAEHHDHEP